MRLPVYSSTCQPNKQPVYLFTRKLVNLKPPSPKSVQEACNTITKHLEKYYKALVIFWNAIRLSPLCK